jgi:TRAP-type transport system small permease protein
MSEPVRSREPTSDPAAGGPGHRLAGRVRRLRRVLWRVEDSLAVGSGIFAVLIMVFTTRDALGRYLFSAPMRGTYETVERLFMVGLVFLAAARTERIGRNVSVSILVDRVSTRAGALMRLIPMLGAAALWGYVAWNSWTRGLERWDTTVFTTVWPMPRGLPWIIASIGLGFLTLRILITSIGEILAPQEFEELAVAKKQVAE